MLLTLSSSLCGPFVGTRQPGFEHRPPTRSASARLVASVNSSRFDRPGIAAQHSLPWVQRRCSGFSLSRDFCAFTVRWSCPAGFNAYARLPSGEETSKSPSVALSFGRGGRTSRMKPPEPWFHKESGPGWNNRSTSSSSAVSTRGALADVSASPRRHARSADAELVPVLGGRARFPATVSGVSGKAGRSAGNRKRGAGRRYSTAGEARPAPGEAKRTCLPDT